MSRLLTVARREYLERVRSRAYAVSTFLGPLLVFSLMLGPGALMARQRGKPVRIAVVDATATLSPAVEQALRRQRVAGQPRFAVESVTAADAESARRKAREGVVEGRLDGYLYLGPGALRSLRAEYYAKNVSNLMDLRLLEEAAREALTERRLADEGLDSARVKALTRKLDLRTIRVSASGGEREDRGQSFLLAMVLLTLLYTTVAMWGAAIMNGVIEEKGNRVVEVIVSSIPTTALFGGKLLGVGAAGLTQFLVWALALFVVSLYGAAAAPGGLSLPELTPLQLVFFVVFFVLGYFLYGALYAAVGSAVNTPQEAQSLAFPVMTPLILSFVLCPAVLASPEGPLAVVLSLIPFLTPMLMFVRITAVTPPAWQIALSLVLTAATVVVVTWAAARVYRVGILMHGKRPTFPEIVRWARMS